MGPISKNPGRRFTKWSGHFRQGAKTVPIPKDVRDVARSHRLRRSRARSLRVSTLDALQSSKQVRK